MSTISREGIVALVVACSVAMGGSIASAADNLLLNINVSGVVKP